MECTSLGACKFTVGRITLDGSWELAVNSQQQQSSSTSTLTNRTGSCIYNITPTLRLPPENSNSNSNNNKKRSNSNNRFPIILWQTYHFHNELYIPLPQQRDDTPQPAEDDGRIIILLFEGMAREDIAISISPTIPSSSKTKTATASSMYQIILGAEGNTRTIISKPKTHQQQQQQQQVKYDILSTPGRVCNDKGWVSYWVCFQPSHELIAVGVGNVPGQHCITITTSAITTPTADDAVRIKDDEIPSTSSSSGENNNNDKPNLENCTTTTTTTTTTNSQQQTSASGYYIGLANVAQYDRQAPAPIKIRNIRYTSIQQQQQQQHPLFTTLQNLHNESFNLIDVTTPNNNTTGSASSIDHLIISGADAAAGSTTTSTLLTDNQLLIEYKNECEKARVRAIKFGIEYKEPPVAAFIPWSEARRLQANPTTGFITGINILHPSEQNKIQQRKQRFMGGGSGGDNNNNNNNTGTDLTDDQEKLELRKQRFQLTTTNNDDEQNPKNNNNNAIVPIEQAWDNEIYVRKFRTDPPRNLWKDNNNTSGLSTSNNDEDDDEGGMDIDPAVLVPEKIHLFTIDWSAFKQIRTEDIMMYFDTYGPSYVEWLGDLSCNVHFQDQYTAQRVLYNLATPIPSPPPTGSEDSNDKVPDLGNMGWYLGKKMITKRQNDRFGKKGTQARVLLRLATSIDILQNRPSSWPQPPPGYTIHEVLGPGSDQYNTNNRNNNNNSKRRRPNDNNSQQATNNNNNNNNSNQRQNNAQQNKGNNNKSTNSQQIKHSNDNNNNNGKKKRNRRNNNKRDPSSSSNHHQQQPSKNNNNQCTNSGDDDEPTGMYTGLSARRDGFTVEEMEAERARKRVKS